jgi:hypothetical protein
MYARPLIKIIQTLVQFIRIDSSKAIFQSKGLLKNSSIFIISGHLVNGINTIFV